MAPMCRIPHLLLLLLASPKSARALAPVTSVAAGLKPLIQPLILTPGTPAANVAAGAAIFVGGDLTAQWLKEHRIDGPRLAGAAALGAVYSGLAVSSVYAAAETLAPGRTPANVLKKMFFSISILSTVGNYVTMFARRALQVLRGIDASDGLRGCVASCNRDIRKVVGHDLKIWPAYDILCYSAIAPAWRGVSTAFASAAWQTYMAIVSARTAALLPAAADEFVLTPILENNILAAPLLSESNMTAAPVLSR
mmetsp:Transcript_9970/g.29827  ORF Transcript_9970/g.29827 Transcript_9970/m.29827 type:complete len:252 (-) Transcript_9970:91-846(-)|eukprot:CAMPEP_0119271476 /NCGR_PEP_ID=MMETSP1329-20130426/8056_1 /TAXON_ID=114041 /ORGANISM="Genus nov. species nov., Strain RCC1024" /LENGTH=251 /DNA_ID=CAMNT_0007271525 /DNA_START=105 /DNA_END=860 /DNA_ORIENTATION=+